MLWRMLWRDLLQAVNFPYEKDVLFVFFVFLWYLRLLFLLFLDC